MEAGEVVFEQLLTRKIQYRVPLFQRTYNWDEEQWDQLWDDLLEIYSMSKPRSHFIGSIVTQPIDIRPETDVKTYMLIDGQQRMTTLLLLLGVVRNRAGTESPAEEVEKMYLNNQFVKNEDELLKLIPTQRDRDAFRSAMTNQPLPMETQIGKAWSYFQKALDKERENGNEVDLNKLKSCIVNHLDMVSISLHEDDSPNRIFESLNNTGMRLSVSDLIRNFLLMNIQDVTQQEHAYNEYWEPMQARLTRDGKDASDDFFWRYLMMEGNLPRKDETFNGVRERLKDEATSERTLEELQRYSKFSHYYAQLVEFESSDVQDSMREQIRRLNAWEVEVAYPFLMDGMDKVASGVISHGELLTVMQMIESFVIRRAVCGVPTNALRRIFAQMSTDVHSKDYVQTSWEYLTRNNWPTDETFRADFVRYRLYVGSRLKRTRLVLDSLQDSFGDKEAPELTEKITIEHIMPQNLSPDWVSSLGPNAAETHDQWLHTVGNLTLTGYNSPLSNKPFAEKKALLNKTNFALSKSILCAKKWNAEAIESRGDQLAQRALGVWKR